ncbi:hypothetical protein [Micromonospora sp. NBC_01813]|uniref:hypothetical protein n=1 Tax=Micromonospora sp. NBC_01813 TaxID=2975988 RepID=UPI002DDA0FA4|nr:hypothetical protein [Micromonospora sp. NBC_01813]WSA08640.1 hypothetical protein OG958_31445 [Micromonospora sp. NBC_01813]
MARRGWRRNVPSRTCRRYALTRGSSAGASPRNGSSCPQPRDENQSMVPGLSVDGGEQHRHAVLFQQ